MLKEHPFRLVRATGLEPAQPCDHKNLNLTRLPIPPRPHIAVGFPNDFYIIHEYNSFVNAFLKVFIIFLAKDFGAALDNVCKR